MPIFRSNALITFDLRYNWYLMPKSTKIDAFEHKISRWHNPFDQ